MSNKRMLSALATGLLLLAGPAAAQEPQEQSPSGAMSPESPATPESSAKGFSFRFDPLVIGAINTDVDTDSSKFQEYRDFSNGFTLGFDLLGESADGERYFDFASDNTGRKDARYTLHYGKVGR